MHLYFQGWHWVRTYSMPAQFDWILTSGVTFMPAQFHYISIICFT